MNAIEPPGPSMTSMCLSMDQQQPSRSLVATESGQQHPADNTSLLQSHERHLTVSVTDESSPNKEGAWDRHEGW